MVQNNETKTTKVALRSELSSREGTWVISKKHCGKNGALFFVTCNCNRLYDSGFTPSRKRQVLGTCVNCPVSLRWRWEKWKTYFQMFSSIITFFDMYTYCTPVGFFSFGVGVGQGKDWNFAYKHVKRLKNGSERQSYSKLYKSSRYYESWLQNNFWNGSPRITT